MIDDTPLETSEAEARPYIPGAPAAKPAVEVLRCIRYDDAPAVAKTPEEQQPAPAISAYAMQTIRRLENALKGIRKAAGSCRHFTNRLQFIYERAGVALSGEEWDEKWRAENGYSMRMDILQKNEKLKERVSELEAQLPGVDVPAEALPVDSDAEQARNDEREGIACFLEARGHHDIASQVFAGMRRPVDEARRRAASAMQVKP